MKKTVIVLVLIFVALITLQLGFFFGTKPFGVLLSKKTVTADFYTREGRFYKEGETEALVIRGVLMDSCLPGHYSKDFAVKEDQYFTWMTQIAEMGANTISVYFLMDPDFYNALYRYNTEHETPLYLIQGVAVPEYSRNNAKDSWEGFYEKLLSDTKDAVDAIHGKQILLRGRLQTGGNYIKDVSPWTIGYLLGSEWKPYTLAYTDNKADNPTSYSGKYLKTSSDATRTEAMFAQLMDEVMDYETHRHGSQRPIGFSNTVSTDPLTYNADVQIQVEKCARLNANHIQPEESNLAGCFAGYLLRGEIEDFMSCPDASDWQEYRDVLIQTNTKSVYGGYVDFLVKLHKELPVVVYYGFSSARGTDDSEGPLSEKQQGQSLVEFYSKYMDAGCQGAIISSWQDNWSFTTWNTMFAVDEEMQKNWLDVQTQGNCFGLLSFDPGQERSVCYVDGNTKEWSAEDEIFSNESFRLFAKYDEAYLYLMISGDKYSEPLYLPIDVTPKSGSTYAGRESARFERFADFLLKLDGKNSANLLVHKRYDAAYMAWEKRISGINAFYNEPEINGTIFGPIRHVLKIDVDASAGLSDMNVEERELFYRYNVLETGLLTSGNGNPQSQEFNSLADYCYGDGCVELRIPWQLLNFSNPSKMKVHDDYYLHYGVEDIRIREIYIGVGTQSTSAVIPMAKLSLTGWNEKVMYHERLKESYYIIQSAWKGGGK